MLQSFLICKHFLRANGFGVNFRATRFGHFQIFSFAGKDQNEIYISAQNSKSGRTCNVWIVRIRSFPRFFLPCAFALFPRQIPTKCKISHGKWSRKISHDTRSSYAAHNEVLTWLMDNLLTFRGKNNNYVRYPVVKWKRLQSSNLGTRVGRGEFKSSQITANNYGW